MPRIGGLGTLLALASIGLVVTVGSTAATFRSQADSGANAVTAAPDFRPPAVSAAVIGKSQGGESGFVKQGGAYFVYANATDSGNPPSGVASLTADLSSLTAGATAVALAPGSFTAGGQSYGYRSAQQTAAASLGEGPVSFPVTATDGASNSAATSWPATVDNTPPLGADVQATNTGGGSSAGRAEPGDTVILTYNEPVEPASILAGWSGAPTAVVVRITTGVALIGGLLGQNEGLQVFDAADSALLPLGAVDLKRQYVANTGLVLPGTMKFGASGTPSTMSLAGGTVSIVLGTHSGNNALTVAMPGTMGWGPSTTPYDRAANAASGTSANESGAADVEF